MPASADILLANIKDVEFEIKETEIESAEKEDHILLEEKIRNEVDPKPRTALLTQVSESDELYEQFTIYPMYEKRPNESATHLYQMLKIHDVPLDNRNKSLDLMCFPNSYPYGCNGQQEDRPIRLTHSEFIKSRLMSKHSQFRADQQYLFYLLNDANNRQLSSGVFYKMNTTNPSERFTAGTYLEKLS